MITRKNNVTISLQSPAAHLGSENQKHQKNSNHLKMITVFIPILYIYFQPTQVDFH